MLARKPFPLEGAEGEYKALRNTDMSDEYQKAPKPKGEIRIPLPKAYSAKAISGDSGIIDTVTRMFCVVDRLVTPVRISEVFEGIATGRSGVGTIHFELSHHAYLSFLYYLGLGGIAFVNEHIYRVEQRRQDEEKQNTYRLLNKFLCRQDQAPTPEHNDEPITDDVFKTLMEMREEQRVNNLNAYLDNERTADKALKEKYSAIFIDPETEQLVFQRHVSATKEPEILKSKVLGSIWEYGVKPFYRAGGFAGFAFWLMWMAATATTGIQLEGIYGMAPWVAVGVPAGFGLMHLGLYYYNAWKYGGFEKARQHAEAVADFDVMLKALEKKKYDCEIEYLHKRNNELNAELAKRKLSIDPLITPGRHKNLVIETPNGVLEQPLVKGAFTIVSNSAANWGGGNSYSWYIKVLVETAYVGILSAPLLGTAVGGVILGLSCAFGIYHGYKRYKEAKALKDDLKSQQEKPGHLSVSLETFEQHYKLRLLYLEQLKSEMQNYKKANQNSIYTVLIPKTFDIPEKNSEDQKPRSFFGKCKEKIYDASIAFRNHPLIDAWDWDLTGKFVGRVLFTTAAPFLLAPLLPIVLTGPIGIAAIAAVGLAFLAISWYEKYQIKKEQRAKQLPGKLEALESHINKAELTLENINMSNALIMKASEENKKQQKEEQEKQLGKTWFLKHNPADDRCIAPVTPESSVSVSPVLAF